MIFKRMLKFSLCALLLGATSSAFAEKEVTLKNGDAIDWSAFVTAINGGSDAALKVAQTEVDNLTAEAAGYEAQLANMPQSEKYTTKMVGWLETAYGAAQTFQADYNAYYADKDSDGSDGEIWYLLVETREGSALYVAFNNVTGYTKATVGTLYNNVLKTKTNVADGVSINLGKDNYTLNNGLLNVSYNETSKASDFANQLVAALTPLTTDNKYVTEQLSATFIELTNKLADIKGGLYYTKNEKGEYVASTKSPSEGTLAAANEKLENAKNSGENYNNVTLNADVTVSTTFSAAYAGTINGDGYAITVPAKTTLFTKGFTGTLMDVAVNLGADASVAASITGASFATVATWNGSTGVYYNASGARSTYSSMNELAFAAREAFGVANLGKENAAFTKLSDSNKVYKLTSYTPTSNPSTSYVYYAGVEGFNTAKGEDGKLLNENLFAQCATTDIAGKGIANVFYGTDNTCELVNITDKVNFYAPVDINATTVEYNRTLAVGNNTVTLPFEVNPANYGKDEICTFDDYAAGKFYFTVNTSTIAANTPILWNAKETRTLNFGKKLIKATPESMIVAGAEGKTPGNQSFGLFKNAKAGEVNGQSVEANIWVLVGNEFKSVSVESTKVIIPAFRSVVYAPTANIAKACQIVLVDEDGNIISEGGSSAVENVAAEAGISIVAGQGEICFTSEADFGNVEVYNLNGGVAAVANVTAGTTYVDLAKGVYVVMGKKVLVK